MKAFLKAQMSVQSDVFSVDAAISACGRVGKWKAALHLVSMIARRSLEFSVITVNAAISAFEMGGEWEKAGLVLS